LAKMPRVVQDLFNDLNAIKFLATVDAEGKPNVVMISSLVAIDEETLAFADLMMNKTKKNLLTTKKVAATVFKPPLASYQVKGTFEGFQTSGFLVDVFNEHELLRHSSYMNVKQAGTIRVEEVYLAQLPTPGKRIA